MMFANSFVAFLLTHNVDIEGNLCFRIIRHPDNTIIPSANPILSGNRHKFISGNRDFGLSEHPFLKEMKRANVPI